LKSIFSDIDAKTITIALPLILSNITIPLVGFVDNAVVGHLGSPIFLGAVGVGSIIISYILFSFGFIKSITASFTSKHDGSSDKRNLLLTLYQILTISLFISFIILSTKNYIIDFSLDLFDAAEDVKLNSEKYLSIRIFSVPAIFLRDILIGYYIGLQQTKKAMFIVIFINIFNALLDYYFVLILGYGVEGVAIASVIAEYSILIFILLAIENDNILTNHKFMLNEVFNWDTMKEKIFFNTNMFIRSFILMTCFAIFMKMSTDYGVVILAVNTILLNFFFIFSYGLDGFAHASETMVGNSIGKKDYNLVKKSIISTGKLSIMLLAVYLIFFITFDRSILNIVTDIVSVKESASLFSFWLYLIFVAGTFAFWLDGVFIGAMKHITMRNIMILSGSIFFFLIVFLDTYDNHGLWLSFLMFFVSRSIFLLIALNRYLTKI
tara:strand:+ start:33442 stop:34752 length:1311 start_codon:yes stop_codon:yes gene_type:complete